jgi:hypothetical protein
MPAANDIKTCGGQLDLEEVRRGWACTLSLDKQGWTTEIIPGQS